MRIIGITGPIASGKSLVDMLLHELGAAPIIDADQVVHDLYESSRGLQTALYDHFGPLIARIDGGIDRRALAARVFDDPAALHLLESVVHPAVRTAVRARLDAAAGAAADTIAVIDAVKLLQGELAELCTVRWWVRTSPVEQRRRLGERGLSEHEIDRRLRAQPRLAEYRERVDLVIDNSGPLSRTERQVAEGWHALSS